MDSDTVRSRVFAQDACRRRRHGCADAIDRLRHSAIGGAQEWPQSCGRPSDHARSRFAMVVAWGPDFRSSTTIAIARSWAQTPAALGTPGREIFQRSGRSSAPIRARPPGEAFAIDDWLLPLERNGYLENCWFTLSYSPIPDEKVASAASCGRSETTGRSRASAVWRRFASSRGARPRRRPPTGVLNAVRSLRQPGRVPFA